MQINGEKVKKSASENRLPQGVCAFLRTLDIRKQGWHPVKGSSPIKFTPDRVIAIRENSNLINQYHND
jgi:hypothetical protein